MILWLEVFNKWNMILHGVRVTPQHGLATDFQKCELEMPVLEGTTEDEMAGWHHWLAGRESGWTLGVGDGEGGLACCDSWGRKESDMTERLNWTVLDRRFLKKLEIELPYDPAIPLLGIHTEETRREWDTCTPMFIAALFIIARTWKQPRCPSADEWIRKLWYIYTMEYYSAIKKNTFESVLMRWMKLEPIIQS